MTSAAWRPGSARPPIIRQSGQDWSCALIVVYGPPGVGKTTLATRAPSPLLIDAEGGAKGWAGDAAPVRSLDELETLIAYLASASHPYETVILDGLNALYANVHEAMNAGATPKDRRLGHVEPGEKLAAALRRLNTLPMLKIITAHSREEADRAGGPTTIALALPPAFREKVEQLADVGAYCWRAGQNRSMVADVVTQGRATIWGKDRAGVFGAKTYPLAWKTLAGGLRLEAAAPPRPAPAAEPLPEEPTADTDVFDDE